MNKIYLIIIFSFIYGWSNAQSKFQLSIGYAASEQLPISVARFSNTDSVTFSRGFTTISASLMVLDSINKKFRIRYGVNFRGTPFSSQLRFETNNDGVIDNQVIIYDHSIVDIHLPFDLIYSQKKWFYSFIGVAPAFKIDLTDKSRYLNTTVIGLSEDELKNHVASLRSHVSTLSVNIRGGIGFRYKVVGLEFAYDRIITNALKKDFQFNGQSRATKMTYGTFIVRLVFNLKSHESRKSLIWDKD